mmetsp:Transcript_1620/g.4325  ORF Transcript_1620/g.4325 Transcript_1620/m.4325 type:complete len:401 (+) Transcript_1620:533-1735(+)
MKQSHLNPNQPELGDDPSLPSPPQSQLKSTQPELAKNLPPPSDHESEITPVKDNDARKPGNGIQADSIHRSEAIKDQTTKTIVDECPSKQPGTANAAAVHIPKAQTEVIESPPSPAQDSHNAPETANVRELGDRELSNIDAAFGRLRGNRLGSHGELMLHMLSQAVPGNQKQFHAVPADISGVVLPGRGGLHDETTSALLKIRDISKTSEPTCSPAADDGHRAACLNDVIEVESSESNIQSPSEPGKASQSSSDTPQIVGFIPASKARTQTRSSVNRVTMWPGLRVKPKVPAAPVGIKRKPDREGGDAGRPLRSRKARNKQNAREEQSSETGGSESEDSAEDDREWGRAARRQAADAAKAEKNESADDEIQWKTGVTAKDLEDFLRLRTIKQASKRPTSL